MRGRWIGTAIAAVLTLAPVVAGAAETAPAGPAEPAAFGGTVEVTTVNVDVVVTRKGRPVTGLTRDDFVLLEDGEPREITNFARVEDGAVYTSEEAAPVPDAERPRYRRHIAIVFDLNFIEKPSVVRAVRTVRRFVHERADGRTDWSVAVVGASATILQPFTSDVEAVDRALDRISGMPTYRALHQIDESLFTDPLRLAVTSNELPANYLLEGSGSDPQALANFATREQAFRSLQPYMLLARGLTDIFRAYATIEGRKACLLVTGKMVLNPAPGRVATSTVQTYPPYPQHGFDPITASILDRVNEIWDTVIRIANASGFRIYSANATGLDDPMLYHDAASRWAGTARPSDSAADWESLPRMLADGTGGRYSTANTINPALEMVDRELRTSYSLGFQPPHGHDGRYHTITVRLKDRKATLRYRRGYYDFSPEEILADQLRTPATFPKTGGSLPVVVRVDTRRDGDQLQVSATAATEVGNLVLQPVAGGFAADVDVWLAIYGPDGEVMTVRKEERRFQIPEDAVEAASRQPFSSTYRFTLPPGTYTVAMALADRIGGSTGLAHAAVTAP